MRSIHHRSFRLPLSTCRCIPCCKLIHTASALSCSRCPCQVQASITREVSPAYLASATARLVRPHFYRSHPCLT